MKMRRYLRRCEDVEDVKMRSVKMRRCEGVCEDVRM